MGKKLFVGSLPYETNDAQLKQIFGACGQVVSARVIMDHATGRSKGFGFVEMSTEDQAKEAIAKLNNTMIGARRIIINEARPPEQRLPGAPRPQRPSGPPPNVGSGGGGGFDSRSANFGADKPPFGARKGGGRDGRFDRKRRDHDKERSDRDGMRPQKPIKGEKRGRNRFDDDEGW